MSKLEQIQTFITVVEENGFAAAARKNKVSTAAVSRQLANLEDDLNAQLLQRTTRQISLTNLGEMYYQHCKAALNALVEAENAITQSHQVAMGILNIMANRYFAISHILPKLSGFMRLNPQLNINFQLAERFPNLEKENIDILFGVSIDGSPELVRRRIATTKYILCASPNYLDQYGTPTSPSDLIGHQYITHSMRNPDNIITFKNEKHIHLKPTLWLNDSYAMRECAVNHMGIVNLHDYIVADAIKDGSLIEILQPFQEPEKNVYLYYKKTRYLQPKIRRFIDFYTEI